jgi:hypothetical protein
MRPFTLVFASGMVLLLLVALLTVLRELLAFSLEPRGPWPLVLARPSVSAFASTILFCLRRSVFITRRTLMGLRELLITAISTTRVISTCLVTHMLELGCRSLFALVLLLAMLLVVAGGLLLLLSVIISHDFDVVLVKC